MSLVRFLSSFVQSPAGRVLRTLLSIGLVSLFLGLIDWSTLSAMRSRLRWDLALGGLVCAAAVYPLHGLRWHLLLLAQGVPARHGWTQAVTWIGTFYNSLLIGGVGGDAARAIYAVREFPEQKPAGLASLVLDRIMGLIVLFALCAAFLALLLPARPLPPGVETLGLWSLITGLSLACLTALALTASVARWPGPLRKWIGPDRVAALESLRLRTLSQPGHHAGALVYSLAIWVADFVSIWLLARAVGLELPFLECSVAATAAYVATVLPISIGGHGVREGTLLATLAAFGLVSPPDQRGTPRSCSPLPFGGQLWPAVWSAESLFSRGRPGGR